MTKYQNPRKTILSNEQLEWFQASRAKQDILSYIGALNEAVVGVKLIDECDISPVSAS